MSLVRLICGGSWAVMSEGFSELPPGYGLARDDVHVWVTRIVWPSDHVRTATGYLSSDEWEKAQRVRDYPKDYGPHTTIYNRFNR